MSITQKQSYKLMEILSDNRNELLFLQKSVKALSDDGECLNFGDSCVIMGALGRVADNLNEGMEIIEPTSELPRE